MRFVLAIISFVLAALMIGLGTAQRTFLAGPDEVSAATTHTSVAPVTVIDGAALNAYEQLQTIQLSGSTKISAAYGRTDDVLAWVGTAKYNHVTFNAETGELDSEVVAGTDSTVPTLSGSDLWLKEYSGGNILRMRLNLPSDLSIIAVADGTAAAPSDVSITWPLDNSSPTSGPLLIGGAALLLIGLVFLLWALTHMRNSRGPRRSQQKLPKMPKLPRQPRYKPSKPKAIAAQKGRRATRRFIAVVPVLLVGSLALTGCTTGFPSLTGQGTTPTPTAVSTDEAASEAPAPAVTVSQITRIVQQIGTATAKADSDMSEKVAATRLAGPALELRLANYAMREKNDKLAEVPTIPSGPVQLSLPQQNTSWPRTIFTIVSDATDDSVSPVALLLVQDTPRDQYKVHYAMNLLPAASDVDLAAATVGAAPISPDFKLLQLEPGSLAKAYGDILLKDKKSASYGLFTAKGDTFREAVGAAAKAKLVKALPKTAKLTFKNAVGDGDVIAMSTNDSGAIVAVQLDESETVRPVKDGATVNATGAVKALLGKSKTTKGIVATYADQLLFYVPSASDTSKKITLLGYGQGLISAKEYKK